MNSLLLHRFMLSCILFAAGCGRHSGNDADPERTVSPHSVNLAGVALFKTFDSLQTLLPNLQCEQKDPDIRLCAWHPTDEEHKQAFRGIDQMKLTFYKDTLQSISAQYLPMMDLEYRNFEQSIRAKYARYTGVPSIDSTTTVWQYDSLIVTLVSNAKPHWTGSLLTYSPVLEFQERTLYRRWMEELEKRKVNPVY
jgi:hypothetical protein